MDARRQKNRDEPASTEEARGETPSADGRGSEAFTAKRETESPASDEHLMEEVCQRENLTKALKQVQRNKGSGGVDRMSVEQLTAHLKEQWPAIKAQLLDGTYQPKPLRRVEIPKPGGGVRKLGIPTVLDRFIQQALLQVLQGRWDRTFSEHCYGFRPGRSQHQAITVAQAHLVAGHRWVVDLDLEKFFDRVNHDILMARLARRVADKRVLKVIRAFLNAGVMENGLVSPTDEGTPQGGPLSPLLSNVVLDDLDRELERRGLRFVRYADDCNVYVRSERAGRRVMEGLKRFLTTKLRLKVNEEKSAVARPWVRKFLGFSFTFDRTPRRRIAPKAIERFKERVRELAGRRRNLNVEQTTKALAVYLRGWIGYFGFCETPSVLRDLDGWIRRRLRCLIWQHWKNGRTRYAELRRRGINGFQAAVVAGAPHGPWHLARHATVQTALPNAFFTSLGLPTMAPARA
jgi:RNA-directed DNA polymerase